MSGRSRLLHERLFVVDLHADSLIWSRDLLQRSELGHLDVPRMTEGNIALQTFMADVEGPFDPDRESIDAGGFDRVFFIALLDRWPLATLRSVEERALFIAGNLRAAAQRSQRRLVLVESRSDLARYVERRKRDATVTAGILGIEGAEPSGYDLAKLQVLFDAGYRMMELAHYTDSPFAGSSSGRQKSGLTPLGRGAVQRMEQLGMIVDVAHASEQATRDVLDVATRPVLATHVGVKGVCQHPRNLADELLDGIAAGGGIVGIGFFPELTCAGDVGGLVRSIRYATERMGAEHVALGSGFDAPARLPFDAAGMVVLTDALLDDGFSEEQVRGIMGGNLLSFLLEALPK